MLIYDLLKSDHREVQRLFREIEESLENLQVDQAELAFEELRSELTAHSKAEQEVFYEPLFLMSKEKQGEDLVWEGEEEHHVIGLLLNELSRMEVDGGDWRAKLKVLSEIVNRHIRVEEEEIFAEARKYFSNTDAEKIAGNMEDLKENYKRMVDRALEEEVEIFKHPMKPSLLRNSQVAS